MTSDGLPGGHCPVEPAFDPNALRIPLSQLDYCTVRYAIGEQNVGEWHIECRFKDGSKYAPIVIDGEHEEMADFICASLNRWASASKRPPEQEHGNV